MKPTGEREAFEAWYRDTFPNANSFDLRHDEVAYAYREVDMAWRAWQAASTAHAALVAERDNLRRERDAFYNECRLMAAHQGIDHFIEQRDALTARCAQEHQEWNAQLEANFKLRDELAETRAKLQAAERHMRFLHGLVKEREAAGNDIPPWLALEWIDAAQSAKGAG